MAVLNFKGKSIVQNHHLAVKYHQLIPRQEKSLTEKVSLNDNLIIHGDNLKALKALLPTYAGKVKCIYIDPPYNTGNEKWAYNDNVNSPMMQDCRDKEALKASQMKELCDLLRADFDYILIDSPAGIEGGFKNAVAGADLAIIVTNPEVAAVRDADRVIGLLEAMDQNYQPRLIVNRLKPELVKKGMMLSIKDVHDILGIELLGIVPEDHKILESANKGVPVIIDRFSKAGNAFLQIARRIHSPESETKSAALNGGWKSFIRNFLGKLMQSLEGGK